MDQDEETKLGPELKQHKVLFFTGAHVDGLTGGNGITQGSKQEKFVVKFLSLNMFV